MNKYFLLFGILMILSIGFVSATDVISTTFSLSGGSAVVTGRIDGFRLAPINNFVLVNGTLDANVNSTECSIWNASDDSLLFNTSKDSASDTCVFDYPLVAGTTYGIVTGNLGGDYNLMYDTSQGDFPITTTNFDIVGDYYFITSNGYWIKTASEHYNFISLTIDNITVPSTPVICNSTNRPCDGTCNVTDLSDMFDDVQNFDSVIGDISSWNTSCITDMSRMFYDTDFNQDISGWDTSSVTDMSGMFYYDNAFNQDISLWDTSKVTSFANMFNHDNNFNQPIGSWNTSSVTDMSYMFNTCCQIQGVFNQNLSHWDTSKVTSFAYMFYQDGAFNGDISTWDTSSAVIMTHMFHYAVSFNGDITNWNTSRVNDMNSMFMYNNLFNQNIGKWDVSSLPNTGDMFWGHNAFTSDTYDAMLNSWASRTEPMGWYLDVGSTQYTSAGATAHNTLINTYGWGFADGGLSGIPCVEDWINATTSCNGFNFTIQYLDNNSCGTIVNLPVDNGSIVACSIPCVESWSHNDSACIGDFYTVYYVDLNHCGSVVHLPVNNGSVLSCVMGDTGRGAGSGSTVKGAHEILVPQSTLPTVTSPTPVVVSQPSVLSQLWHNFVAWLKSIFG